MLRLLFGLVTAMLVLIGIAAQVPVAAQSERVDVAIVLAVDTSASVDSREFLLQMRGLADALIHPEVIKAIGQGEHGAIAVSIVQWSSFEEQAVTEDWIIIRTADDAAGISRRALRTPRLFGYRGTAIADVLDYARRHMSTLPYSATRRVIDISGDGKNNQPPLLRHARERAVQAGITVNGLPIISTDPSIHYYYQDSVIAGPGSFIEIAESFESFGTAMIRKLLREIRGDPAVSMR